jgi:hypothetical protein
MRRRLRYQVTRRGLLAVSTALTISICLFWYGGEDFVGSIRWEPGIEVPMQRSPYSWWAILVGASFMGGALGAAIGHAFQDERGGAASMGAFVGALAGPPIAMILYFALFVANGGMSV